MKKMAFEKGIVLGAIHCFFPQIQTIIKSRQRILRKDLLKYE